MVDSRWICKVTDYALHESSELSKGNGERKDLPANKLLWTAPELLRSNDPFKGSKPGDVYSFGVILQEITLQDEPFCHLSSHRIAKSPCLKSFKGTIEKIIWGSGSFCCHARVGGHPDFKYTFSLDSRLRGNRGFCENSSILQLFKYLDQLI